MPYRKTVSAIAAISAVAALSPAVESQTQTKPPARPVEKAPVSTIAPQTPPGVYTFTLTNFRITDTRALHNDSDYVAISVAVNGKPAINVPAKSMGDVNNGVYPVNLTIANVTVEPTNTVAFTYSIVNSGYKDSLGTALGGLVSYAATKAAEVGALGICGMATGGASVAASCVIPGEKSGAWAMGKLGSIIFANCDGTVAGATHAFTGAALAKGTSDGRAISGTDDNPGTPSPQGCGANSRYYVSWMIAARQAPHQPGDGSSGGGRPTNCQTNGEGCLKPK
jgi:hypothetical protein